MGLLTNREYRTAFDDAEDLASTSSGGSIKMWIVGIGIALVPIIYGTYSLIIGHTYLPGRGSSGLDLTGTGAQSLAIAYISVGIFIHFHFFWGLHPRLYRFSQLLKIVPLLAFLGSFFYTIFLILR